MRYLFLIFIFIFAGCGDEVTVVEQSECEFVSDRDGVSLYSCERIDGLVKMERDAMVCDSAIFTVENGVCSYVYDKKGMGVNKCESGCEFDCSEIKTYSEISGKCTNQLCDSGDDCVQGCRLVESLNGFARFECSN